jgi:hypothetical protein
MPVLILALLAVLVPALASAAVVNVELKFTPYVGKPAKADKVDTVPGTAAIFVNGVPYAEQTVPKDSVPVLSEAREIAPVVWIPVDALGPVIRKGKNTIRIEFTPLDAQTSYRGRFSWATITDEETTSEKNGKQKSTNMQAPGQEDKAGKGTMVFERAIDADFASDVPWHHYPAVRALDDDDKRKMTALVMARGAVFAPDFKGFYAMLASNERVDVAKLKDTKCVEAAYAAGVRLDAPKADQLDFVMTGNPEVVIRRLGDHLFKPADPAAFGKIEDEETQMCAGIALSIAFPPQLVVVRDPDGTWRVAY